MPADRRTATPIHGFPRAGVSVHARPLRRGLPDALANQVDGRTTAPQLHRETSGS